MFSQYLINKHEMNSEGLTLFFMSFHAFILLFDDDMMTLNVHCALNKWLAREMPNTAKYLKFEVLTVADWSVKRRVLIHKKCSRCSRVLVPTINTNE